MTTTALDVRQAADLKPWTPTFTMSVDDAVAQVDMKREFYRRVMVDGTHYGTIPGTPKPSLWKPGAELLLSTMGLHCVVGVTDSIRDYTGRDHNGEPFLEFLCTGTVYRQIGMRPEERMVIAQADGLCHSWETKYRWRDAKRRCPDCGQETIYESKKGEGGWFCWKAKGGCGHEFAVADARVAAQPIGKVRNPDVADLANTILKIGGKRGYVAAALLATGCSDIFTQDMADEDDEPREARGETPTGSSRTGRPNGNGGNGGRTNLGGGATDEQLAELLALNERLGDRKWSPPILKGKASRPNGYATTKAELEELLAKVNAAPGPGRAYNAETGEIEPAAPPADPDGESAR